MMKYIQILIGLAAGFFLAPIVAGYVLLGVSQLYQEEATQDLNTEPVAEVVVATNWMK